MIRTKSCRCVMLRVTFLWIRLTLRICKSFVVTKINLQHLFTPRNRRVAAKVFANQKSITNQATWLVDSYGYAIILSIYKNEYILCYILIKQSVNLNLLWENMSVLYDVFFLFLLFAFQSQKAKFHWLGKEGMW